MLNLNSTLKKLTWLDHWGPGQHLGSLYWRVESIIVVHILFFTSVIIIKYMIGFELIVG